MCVEANGYKFIRALRIQLDKKEYRILITGKMNSAVNGFYGICIDNGIFAVSRKSKPIAIHHIVKSIVYHCLEVEKAADREPFRGKEINYIGAINGEARDLTNTCINDAEKNRRINDHVLEMLIKPAIAKLSQRTKYLSVLHTRV